jgi:hypothetical protein
VPDRAGKRRVVIYQRCSGTYGFLEQHFLDGPTEFRWIDVGPTSKIVCDTEEDALREATRHISWLHEPEA